MIPLNMPRLIAPLIIGLMLLAMAALGLGCSELGNILDPGQNGGNGDGNGDGGGEGTLRGSVRAMGTGDSLSGVQVALASTGASGGTIVATATTDAQGEFSMEVQVGTAYQATFSRSGYRSASYHGIEVVSGQTTHLQAVELLSSSIVGTGNVTGRITDATTGAGVPNLNVGVRSGINVRSGQIVLQTTTNDSGDYSLSNLPTGHYTAEASGTGFARTYFAVVVLGGLEIPNQNASISPGLSEGETRIVLNWGAAAVDLDAHLTGPDGAGGRFHVYYSIKNFGSGAVVLDRDTRTGPGDETITIHTQTTGVYRYSIHDFTNKDASASAALAESQAVVQVFRAEGLVQTFNVPSSGGTLWTVFELSDGVITPINTMSYQAFAADVAGVRGK